MARTFLAGEMENLRADVLRHLKKEFSSQEMATWIDPLEIEMGQDNQVRIGYPHPLFASWFGESIRERFEACLAEFLAPGVCLVYESAPRSRPKETRGLVHESATVGKVFGRQYTFAGFLVNSKNFFPLESAKEVVRQGHERFNPFVVCGESGSGKSHLLRAMANSISRRVGAEAIYLGSPLGLTLLVEQQFGGDWRLCRHWLLRHEFLFLDDLQQLHRDETLRMETALLVDGCMDQDRQVVCAQVGGVSSALGQRLASRLSSGLIVNLKLPDLAIRLKYAQRVNRSKGLRLNKEQCLTLAQRFPDMRGLQGILLKIGVFRNIVHRDLEDKDFEHILSHTESVSGEGLTPDGLMREAADFFSVSVDDLKGRQRGRQIVEARQAAMYVMRQLLGCSYPVLGRIFGGKDHSTVMHAVKKMERIVAQGGEMHERLVELKKRCRALEK